MRDPVPSTFDMPPISGGQDPVLAMLTQARERYEAGASPNVYMRRRENGGALYVCAAGAVLSCDEGLAAYAEEHSPDLWDRDEDPVVRAMLRYNHERLREAYDRGVEPQDFIARGNYAYDAYENLTRETTKEAMALLDEAAEALYGGRLNADLMDPESPSGSMVGQRAHAHNGDRCAFGAIECVNQHLSVEWHERCEAVLACYDEAIRRRTLVPA